MNTNKTETEQLTQDAVMQSVLIKGLRINNYYELKGSVLGGGICQLKNLKDFIHIGNLIESDLVKPIPLTEEWLLKFGFEKITEFSFCFDKFICEYFLQDIIVSFRLKYNPADSLFIRDIKYVHELQNIYFALTGSELTVA